MEIDLDVFRECMGGADSGNVDELGFCWQAQTGMAAPPPEDYGAGDRSVSYTIESFLQLGAAGFNGAYSNNNGNAGSNVTVPGVVVDPACNGPVDASGICVTNTQGPSQGPVYAGGPCFNEATGQPTYGPGCPPPPSTVTPTPTPVPVGSQPPGSGTAPPNAGGSPTPPVDPLAGLKKFAPLLIGAILLYLLVEE